VVEMMLLLFLEMVWDENEEEVELLVDVNFQMSCYSYFPVVSSE
jgi:hypothetical protein